MRNTLTIIPTIFTDTVTGQTTKGVRIADDYGQTYINYWENIPDDDLAILTNIISGADEQLTSMLYSLVENEKGVHIGNTYYEWDQIKHLFSQL